MRTLPLVANLLTSDELDKLTRRLVTELRRVSLVQREIVIRALVEDDERARQRSPSGFTPSRAFALTVRRDGVM